MFHLWKNLKGRKLFKKSMRDDELLIILARLGGNKRKVEISLRAIAKQLRTSKQTVGRKLEKLQREGRIVREYAPKGTRVKITAAGVARLKALYLQLKEIFEALPSLKFTGEVVSGIREGSYYIRQPKYAEQLKKILGFVPYPGTVNIKVDEETVKEMAAFADVEIKGFVDEGRSFGGARLCPARLEEVDGAIIFPTRTHHRDIIEFIAAKNLRKTLKLKDGDIVEVEVPR